MNLHNLMTALSPFHPVPFVSHPYDTVEAVRFLRASAQGGGHTTLLLGTLEDFLVYGVPAHTKNILILGAEAAFLEKRSLFPEVNCILIPPETDRYSLFNTILDLIAQENQTAYGAQLLSSSQTPALHAMEMTQILDCIYELLGNPFSICNSEGVLIDYKEIDRISGPDDMMFAAGDYVPVPDTFMEICQQVNLSTEPLMFLQFAGLPLANVVSKITLDGKPIAYFLMLACNKPILPSDLALVKTACQWLSIEFLRKKTFLTPKASLISHLLADLLSEVPPAEEAIQKRCAELNFAKKEWNHLLVADCADPEMSQYQIRGMCQTLELLVPGSHAIVHQRHIVVHINTSTYEFFTPSLQARLTEAAATHKWKLGLGYRYHRLGDTLRAYDQGMTALTFGSHIHPDRMLYFYDDYALYHLLDQAKGKEDLRRFCHPKLLELLAYDAKNDTCYAKTLFVLILAGGRQAEAAKKLHIHRSTMLYRIEKIMEITDGLDLRDISVGTRLFLSYSILIFTGDIAPEEFAMPGTESV